MGAWSGPIGTVTHRQEWSSRRARPEVVTTIVIASRLDTVLTIVSTFDGCVK